MAKRGAGGRFVKAIRRTVKVTRKGTRRARGLISRLTHGGGLLRTSQIGTKVIAGELVSGAALLPAVVPTGTMNGNIVGEIEYAVRTGDTGGYRTAVEAWPYAVQDAALQQLGIVIEAGVIRLVGRVLGV